MRKRIAIGVIIAVVLFAAVLTATAAAAPSPAPLEHPGAKVKPYVPFLLPPPKNQPKKAHPAGSGLPSSTAQSASLLATAYAGKANPRGQYDLSWTLPTAGKSGCLVCHGDSSLVRIQDGKIVSLTVDYDVLQLSAHHDVQCTGCHIDFAYKVPHENAKTSAWRSIAKSACKNCHQNQFAAYTSGVHAPLTAPGVKPSGSSAKGKPAPLCGDCHGGHSIPTTGAAGEAVYQASGMKTCGQCHEDEAASYSDYYHGAAYKRGAPDAPACWNCHDPHATLPSSDQRSSTNAASLQQTCGGSLAPGMRCHANPGAGFLQYAKLIHGRAKVADQNPFFARILSAEAIFGQAFEAMKARFASR